MRIIGFNLTKISAEKQDKSQDKLEINQNIDIKDIVEEKIPITDDKILKISFSLTITYSNNYAKIEFEGNLLILPEKDELKKFLESWKDKKLPNNARIHLFNFIMNKCNIRALYLEDELTLPLHIPLPKISPDQKLAQKTNSQ